MSDSLEIPRIMVPFCALRPTHNVAASLISPPYDVLSEADARRIVDDNPDSFLHVSRPEVNFPIGQNSYSEEVYDKAATKFSEMISKGNLIRDESPGFYVWQMRRGNVVQTGVAAAASIAAYRQGRIARHELTRPEKEKDRSNLMIALNAHTGPVLLAYRESQEIQNFVEIAKVQRPILELTCSDGVEHVLWKITDSKDIENIEKGFDKIDKLYIADGHHRSAAAASAQTDVWGNDARISKAPYSDRFLVVAFPLEQLQVFPYHRLIKDLNGLSSEEFLRRIKENFLVKKVSQPVSPANKGVFGLYLGKVWYRLERDFSSRGNKTLNEQLDVTILAEKILSPVLNIHDQRNDKRVDFLGGVAVLGEMVSRVDSGDMVCGVSVYPTSAQEMAKVVDTGGIMPPKSTWFEPKLVEGLLNLQIL